MLSISDALISLLICDGCESLSLKTDSRTESSVEVVSWPVKAHQSFTTIPAPITSAPRLMVPATSGTCAHIGHVVSRVTGLHLQQGAQLLLVRDGGLGRHEAALVTQGAVAADLRIIQ